MHLTKRTQRDPTDELPYVFDLDAFMLTGDTIAGHAIAVEDANGLTVPPEGDPGGKGSSHAGPFVVRDPDTGEERTVTKGVLFWPLGGLDDPTVLDPPPKVVCTVTTAMGTRFDLAWVLPTKER